MLNQAAVEELYCSTYLANYLSIMENLPHELQRQVTLMKELDVQTRELLNEVESQQEVYLSNTVDVISKKKALKLIERRMLQLQEIGDEKIHITAVINELIENRTRQLDQDSDNLDPNSNKNQDKVEEIATTKKVDIEKSDKSLQKRQKRQKQEIILKDDDLKDDSERAVKKRKRRSKKEKGESRSAVDLVDPDEPIYCLCEQVSYGDMIGCDNESCLMEWFHFNCVGLSTKPKGKWYCPSCRGDRASIKRPDLK